MLWRLVKETARYRNDKHAVRAPDRRAAVMTWLREPAIREGVAQDVVRRTIETKPS